MSSHARELVSLRHLGADLEVWEPRYVDYDRKRLTTRLSRLEELLSGSVPAADIEHTWDRVEAMFDEYEGRVDTEPASFAYFVPARVERANPAYGSESFATFPVLKYVDSDVRQRFLSGIPPFVIDRYFAGPDGLRGALVFSGVFPDMFSDIPGTTKAVRAARQALDDAASFAARQLAVRIGGLASVLPRLTQLGRTVNAPYPITSGHGGTVWLIAQLVQAAMNDGLVNSTASVTVIGAGAIGTSAAHLLLGDGIAEQVVLHDMNQGQLLRAERELQDQHGPTRVRTVDSLPAALGAADVIVAAVTSNLPLDPIDPDAQLDLGGKLVIDDSVPGSFDRPEVERRGGLLTWVIGEDNSPSRSITRQGGYNYGESGLARACDLWGCEAELGALTLSGRLDTVVNDPVTPDVARFIGKLFDEARVGPAPYQCFGRLLVDTMRHTAAPA